jgi:hypothetical protein
MEVMHCERLCLGLKTRVSNGYIHAKEEHIPLSRATSLKSVAWNSIATPTRERRRASFEDAYNIFDFTLASSGDLDITVPQVRNAGTNSLLTTRKSRSYSSSHHPLSRIQSHKLPTCSLFREGLQQTHRMTENRRSSER